MLLELGIAAAALLVLGGKLKKASQPCGANAPESRPQQSGAPSQAEIVWRRPVLDRPPIPIRSYYKLPQSSVQQPTSVASGSFAPSSPVPQATGYGDTGMIDNELGSAGASTIPLSLKEQPCGPLQPAQQHSGNEAFSFLDSPEATDVILGAAYSSSQGASPGQPSGSPLSVTPVSQLSSASTGTAGSGGGVGAACFTPGTLIKLRGSNCPIYSIMDGDEVSDGKGGYNRVKQVLVHSYSGEIILLDKSEGVTPDHPMPIEPAEKVFAGYPRRLFRGSVYNIHCDGNHLFELASGQTAHNFLPSPIRVGGFK